MELDAESQAVRDWHPVCRVHAVSARWKTSSIAWQPVPLPKDNYDDAAGLKKYWGYLANNVVWNIR